MTDEELNKTLIARLRKVDEYEPLGHDGWEAADRIEQLVATNEALVKASREDALELLAALGQAQEAYEAQLKAEARAKRLEEALRLLHDNVVLAFPTLADLGPVANARAALITEKPHDRA